MVRARVGGRPDLVLGVVTTLARKVEEFPLGHVDVRLDPLLPGKLASRRRKWYGWQVGGLQDELHGVVRHLLSRDIHL
jgi:hypothetical protein